MPERQKITILYGSQTGQAESIATQLHEEACFRSFDASLFCLKDEGKLFNISEISCAIIVCSTTGEGDPPENARKFIRTLNRKTIADSYLADLRYALLGLGDTNYSTFCGGPKKLEKALRKCGATTFYKTAYADDATDMEDTVEPWLDGLWNAVDEQCRSVKESEVKNSSNYSESEINVTTLEKPVQHVHNSLSGSVNGISNKDTASINNSTANAVGVLEIVRSSPAEDVCPSNNATPTICEPSNNSSNTHDFDSTKDNQTVACSVNDAATAVQQLALSEDVSTEIGSSSSGNKPQNTEKRHLVMENGLSDQNNNYALKDVTLTIPPVLPIYLESEVLNSPSVGQLNFSYQNGFPFPMACGPVIEAKVTSLKQLSADNATKQTLEVQLESEEMFSYQPGDSFAICCENDEAEVDWLLNRLKLNGIADKMTTLQVKPGTAKKNAAVPQFIPHRFTIRQALTSCLEIRSVPKKPFLRALVECTSDASDKRRLEELCSRQGADLYTQYVRQPSICILDILSIFPSCQPSFALLVQHLPRLQARRYSVANSPLNEPRQLRIVFNVVNIDPGQGRRFRREGVFTGSMKKLYGSSSQGIGEPLCIFPTKSNEFHLPSDPSTPVVMIGPGTGVAPFIGFLQHREAMRSSANVQFGESWLFYGCRFKDRDFLYEKELRGFKQAGVLNHLEVAFSRESLEENDHSPRYVQHLLKLHSKVVAELLLNTDAIFYVCGDARNMAKDVRQCVLDIISDTTSCDQAAALETFKRICAQKRYKEDIWT